MSLMMEKGLSPEFLTADAVFMGMTRKLVVEERGGVPQESSDNIISEDKLCKYQEMMLIGIKPDLIGIERLSGRP